MSLAPAGLFLSLALAAWSGQAAPAHPSPPLIPPGGTDAGAAAGHPAVRTAQRAASVREGVRRTKRLWRHETTGRGSRPASPLPPRATAPGDAPRTVRAPAPLPPAAARRVAAPVPESQPQTQPQTQPQPQPRSVWDWLRPW